MRFNERVKKRKRKREKGRREERKESKGRQKEAERGINRRRKGREEGLNMTGQRHKHTKAAKRSMTLCSIGFTI